jgi:type IV pilus assembly protein PilW
MHPHSSYPFFHHNRGFSLVELMVGMTLGLLVVLVIMQSFSIFETQKRTTTAGSDAQSSGLMAMTQLEQEIRNAGAGFTSDAAFDCSNMYSYHEVSNGNVTSPVPAFSGGMAPVVITDGGTGPDTVTIKRGTDFLGSIPASITDAMPQPSAELNVSFTQGFTVGDKIVVSQGGNCTVMEVTQVQDAALKIQHNPGGFPSWNPQANFYNTAPGNTWPTFTSGARILNIGDMVVKTYSIDANNNLQMVDSSTISASNGTYPLVKDIVSLQAQYGIADTGNQNVNAWVDATGSWSALDSTEIKRIKAIRLTIVARSSKKEISNVTTSAPGGVNVSTLPDWQKYRYRVYTTIIPLRNIIWSNV